jgi:hypothetical protein
MTWWAYLLLAVGLASAMLATDWFHARRISRIRVRDAYIRGWSEATYVVLSMEDLSKEVRDKIKWSLARNFTWESNEGRELGREPE